MAMASSFKPQLVSLFHIVCLLLQIAAAAATTTYQTTSPGKGKPFGDLKMDCRVACAGRCRLSSRQQVCLRVCGACCVRCNCVPPGTSGNQEFCPCYARLTTHNNRFKCP